jgi:hypothetical protein
MVWKPGQSGNLNGRPRKYPRAPEGMDPQQSYDYFRSTAIRDEYRAIAEAQDLEDPVLFQHRLGALDEARTAAKAGLALNPGFTIRRFRATKSSDNPTFLVGHERACMGMRLAGVPEG